MASFRAFSDDVDELDTARRANQATDALTGLLDVGALSLASPVAAPPAPTLTATGVPGNPNGTYDYSIRWVTGFYDETGERILTGFSLESPTANIVASLEKVTVEIDLGDVPGYHVIGWQVIRNKNGSGTRYTLPVVFVADPSPLNQPQYRSATAARAATGGQPPMPTLFTDNVADASLVSTLTDANSTGTTLAGCGKAFPTGLLAGVQGGTYGWLRYDNSSPSQGDYFEFPTDKTKLNPTTPDFDPTTQYYHTFVAGDNEKGAVFQYQYRLENISTTDTRTVKLQVFLGDLTVGSVVGGLGSVVTHTIAAASTGPFVAEEYILKGTANIANFYTLTPGHHYKLYLTGFVSAGTGSPSTSTSEVRITDFSIITPPA